MEQNNSVIGRSGLAYLCLDGVEQRDSHWTLYWTVWIKKTLFDWMHLEKHNNSVIGVWNCVLIWNMIVIGQSGLAHLSLDGLDDHISGQG